MSKDKEVRLPISVKMGGVYHPPGTAITGLSEKDANDLIAKHGEFDGPVSHPMDPANTNSRTVDAASIAMLNEQTKVIEGAGRAPAKPTGKPAADGDDLDGMKKDELIDYVKAHNLDVDTAQNKPELIADIKKAMAAKTAA